MISKLMRLYKRSHGLRQICNIAVYIIHSACTIHLLNLPDKNAKRDLVHGVKHLEEIAEGWLGARRTLAILSVIANKWKVEMPEEAMVVLARTDAKFGTVLGEVQSPPSQTSSQRRMSDATGNPIPPPMWNPPAHVTPPLQHAAPVKMRPDISISVPDSHGMLAPSPNFDSPHQDTNRLRAQQSFEAPSTTTSISANGTRSWASIVPAKGGSSPSDMFGGVEQLIRDSQDWAYREQAQMAAGFENWNRSGLDSPQWGQTPMVSNASMSNNLQRTALGGPVQNVGGNPSPIPTHPGSGYDQLSPTSAVDGMGMANWLNGMNAFNTVAGAYNEEEWYQ
jgi:hypothetical protein